MRTTTNGEIIYEYKDINKKLLDEIRKDIKVKGVNRNRKIDYISDFITMDIETSTLGRSTDTPLAFTYSIAIYITGKCLWLRDWQQYIIVTHKLKNILKLTKYNRLVCYVHNLPYEFQFMRDFMLVDDMFAVQPRKVVKFYSSGIEYRCSYKLTNMGLARFTASTPNVKHKKLSGEDFDYSIIRTPNTYIPDSKLDYIYNDVAGLYEALDYMISNDKYNIATIPLTSTGFVRNELRNRMRENPKNRFNFIDTKLNQYTYGLLREARRGGNTHCNPVYSDMTVAEVNSMDMSSAYPAVMVECKFPMTPFVRVQKSRLPDYDMFANKYACIMDITFKEIEVKTLNTIPYIAKAHCTGFPKIKSGEEKNSGNIFRSDNGRVLKSRKLSMVITDIDYRIIRDTYNWSEIIINDLYISRYDYLPDELRKTILKQYYDKTTLKDKDEYLYMKQKNKFNANFGCMLTDICQDDVVYNPKSKEPFSYSRNKSFQEQLDKYYNSRKSFLSYQHGVWVTAHCRYRLQKAINALETDMIYCDTDSVKYYASRSTDSLFEELNSEIKEDITKCGLNCSVEYKGKIYTLGLWEDDGEYKYFKSMGAKKYCYIDKEDNFNITVAGLSKSKAKDYLLELADKQNKDVMDIFEAGTIVPKGKSGRTTAKYNDYTYIREIEVDGEVIRVGSNMVIEDTTYEFGMTEDYETLITDAREGVIW